MYAVTTINCTGTVLLHMDSIAQVRNWAEANNLVLGRPGLHLPLYSIEHADGSLLSKEEMHALQPESSKVLFARRQAEAWDAICGKKLGLTEADVPSIYEGVANAIIASVGR